MQSIPATTHEDYYQAYLNQDSRFEGVFYLAVKTTGIFCRPGCRARPPKRENVEFFSTTHEALNGGYRPCKKCHPLTNKGQTPTWVQQALNLVMQQPGRRVSDQDLQQHGIQPSRLRRWFKQEHGMTFQAYQRLLRVGRAYDQIKQGKKVITSAYDSGYNSLSGFQDRFRQLTGFSPSSSKSNHMIQASRILTPLGPMLAAADEQGLCLLEFLDRKDLQLQINRVQRLLKGQFMPGDLPLFNILQQQMDEYFKQQRQGFDLPINGVGTDFQQTVWQALLDIPFAQTRSYQEQAIFIGKPNAIRAVARANGQNSLAIVVPCHRVIGKSGQLTGYSGGLHRKQFLIDLEAS